MKMTLSGARGAVGVRRFRSGGGVLAILSLLVALLPVGCASFNRGAVERELTEAERELNVAAFEHVWRTVHEKHWDDTFNGVDWDATHDAYLPRVRESRTLAEARSVMTEMLGLLGKSHFYVIPAGLYDDRSDGGSRDGVAGMAVRVVDMRALVVGVDERGPARDAGVEPGWEVLSIGDDEVAALLGELAAEYGESPTLASKLSLSLFSRLRGGVGDEVVFGMIDRDGREVEVPLTLAQAPGEKFTFSNLPPAWVNYESRRLPGDMGYVAFNVWMDPGRLMTNFQRDIAAFADCPGLVIDLRGNTGGIAGMASGFAGFFMSEKGVHLGTMIYRAADLKLIVNPRPRSYAGKVAILIDGLSASTSEFFAGGLQDLGMARLFGQRSAGAALLANMDRLPNGDGFEYAIANYTSASGRELEGDGVVPDVIVTPTRSALLAEGDPVLAAALSWLRAEN